MRSKKIREKGKIKLSRMFQELKSGDTVAIKRELAVPCNFPARIQGMTGIIDKKRGMSYIVKIKDLNKEKQYIIKSVHLLKLK